MVDTKVRWATELGILKKFWDDSEITEIMVNGPDSIYVEKDGKISNTGESFTEGEELDKIVASIARFGGYELSRKAPCGDIMLPDGSRANIVVASAAVSGPYLTIRRAQVEPLDLKFLVDRDFVDQKALYFLNVCIANRLNLIVSGGTSTGKTTLLNALIGMIPANERLVTIEDTLELSVRHTNLAQLEARPRSTYSEGLTAKDLVRNALRMRPNRIIVGETRGGEAWDIIQAMNSGHEGSLTAIHANYTRGALNKMEAFVLMEEEGISVDLVRRHIANIINIVVQVERDDGGHRHISEISEVVGIEDGEINVQPLFARDADQGLKSLGVTPQFLKRRRRRVSKGFPDDFFDPEKKITLDGF